MRSVSFSILFFLLLAACGGARQVSPADDPGRGTDAGSCVEVSDAAVDPCDKTFRAYGENGNYVDVHVGALPKVTLTSPQQAYTVAQGQSVGSSITISSLEGCGVFELLGVDVLIERTDGTHFPFVRGSGPINHLYDSAEAANTWDSPTFWSGSSLDSETAYLLWAAWDEVGPSVKAGAFDAITVEAEEVARFDLDLPVIAALPVGEYRLIHAVHWKDQETGTEVWYEDFDGAIQTVTVQ